MAYNIQRCQYNSLGDAGRQALSPSPSLPIRSLPRSLRERLERTPSTARVRGWVLGAQGGWEAR